MNQNDREALAAISKQIAELSEHLAKLADEDTVKALEGLVEIAPTLKDLADGYRLAGKAGNFIKWIASVAAGLVALWGFLSLYVFGVEK